jgi:hypothetical protein
MFYNIGTSAAMLAGCSLALGVSSQLLAFCPQARTDVMFSDL